MKLTRKEILDLVSTGHTDAMPDGTVVGFIDYDGRYYPIYALDEFFYTDIDFEPIELIDGVECYILHFFF